MKRLIWFTQRVYSLRDVPFVGSSDTVGGNSVRSVECAHAASVGWQPRRGAQSYERLKSCIRELSVTLSNLIANAPSYEL